MLENKYKKQFVDRLDVNQNAINILKENNINTLWDLSNYKTSQLVNIGIEQNIVDEIETRMELLGIRLK